MLEHLTLGPSCPAFHPPLLPERFCILQIPECPKASRPWQRLCPPPRLLFLAWDTDISALRLKPPLGSPAPSLSWVRAILWVPFLPTACASPLMPWSLCLKHVIYLLCAITTL